MSRNEPARERHRRRLKEGTSLRSLPLDDSRGRILTLENHFGWTVLQKCQVGDGNIPTYPQVVQYHEKPEVSGPEYRQLTYVLYLKGGKEEHGALGRKEKEVQTMPKVESTAKDNVVVEHRTATHRAVEQTDQRKETVVREDRRHKKKKEEHPKVPKEEPPKVPKEHPKVPKEEPPKVPREEHGSDGKKKKLVDSFYYRKRDRSSDGDRIFRPIETDDAHKLPENNPVAVENYTTDYVPKGKKPKHEKARNKPKSWQLRTAAGAERGSRELMVHNVAEVRESDEDMEEEDEEEESCGENLKLRDTRGSLSIRQPQTSRGDVSDPALSKTNEYLYISKTRERVPTDPGWKR